MPRNLKYLVPLLTALSLMASSANGATANRSAITNERCMQAFVNSDFSVVQPGQSVKFEAVLRPSHVDAFTLAVVKMQGMQLLRKGSAPYAVVEGQPIWTRHNLSSQSFIRFRAMVDKHAVRGRRLIVQFAEHAVAANCDQTDPAVLPFHVAKHKW
jgi:hypothetical protein